jgi:hypothetical protein
VKSFSEKGVPGVAAKNVGTVVSVRGKRGATQRRASSQTMAVGGSMASASSGSITHSITHSITRLAPVKECWRGWNACPIKIPILPPPISAAVSRDRTS